MATQGSPELQESTAKQNSAVCIIGVNKIAPNFVTLVATYMYVVWRLRVKIKPVLCALHLFLHWLPAV